MNDRLALLRRALTALTILYVECSHSIFNFNYTLQQRLQHTSRMQLQRSTFEREMNMQIWRDYLECLATINWFTIKSCYLCTSQDALAMQQITLNFFSVIYGAASTIYFYRCIRGKPLVQLAWFRLSMYRSFSIAAIKLLSYFIGSSWTINIL